MSSDGGGLVAFLNARLDEDEATARAAAEDDSADWFANAQEGWDADERSVRWTGPSTLRPGDTWDYPVCRNMTVGAAGHIARYDPARVLREVKAKRAILKRYERWSTGRNGRGTLLDRLAAPPGAAAMLPALLDLAAVYSDHPDCRPEWAVSSSAATSS